MDTCDERETVTGEGMRTVTDATVEGDDDVFVMDRLEAFHFKGASLMLAELPALCAKR